MSTKRIEQLVAEAIAKDREIQQLTEELKGLKADLVVLAEAEPPARREATDGGGFSVTYETADGSIARVTQPGAKLKSVIDTEKPAGAKLKEKVGKVWDQLFRPAVKWSPVAEFRERVAELFSPREAAAILRAATTESAPTVSFETKEAA